MMKHTPTNLFVVIALSLFLSSCSNSYQKLAANYQINKATTRPDYNDVAYWAAHPAIHDPSDRVPAPLQASYEKDTSVDVFFIHPTTYLGAEKPFGMNANISDAFLAAKTDYSPVLYQGSLFNVAGRLYAPRYRQTHISAYYPTTSADTTLAIAAFELAYQDVKTAFEYYLANENKGRPIIIASHSQGTTHGIRLVKEFFDGKPLQKQLVEAYLIGIATQPDTFENIKPSNAPNEIGGFVSWNTYARDFTAEYHSNGLKTAVSTNPLTWKIDEEFAPKELNKGGVGLKYTFVKQAADAQNHQGMLWINKPYVRGRAFLKTKVWHVADINLFWMNIRENVALRLETFLKQ
jgi:hypothetical protein